MIRTTQNGMVRTTPSNGGNMSYVENDLPRLAPLLKHAGGRPTKYDPNVTPDLAAMAVLSKGPTDIDIAMELGIHFITVGAWEKEKPEFSLAIKKAREHLLYYRGQSLTSAGRGTGFVIWCMKNWCEWKDVQVVEDISKPKKIVHLRMDLPSAMVEKLLNMPTDEARKLIEMFPVSKEEEIIDV